jgi:hypothetical protein
MPVLRYTLEAIMALMLAALLLVLYLAIRWSMARRRR